MNYLDKDWLYEQRYVLDKSSRDIAKMCGVHYVTIDRNINKFGIRKELIYADKDWLYNQYIIQEKSTVKIAKECDIDTSTVLCQLKKFNIKTRPQKGSMKSGEECPNWKGGLVRIVCINCGKERMVTRADMRRRGAKFCSRECSLAFSRKQGNKQTDIEKITEDWLIQNNVKYKSEYFIRLKSTYTLVDFFIEPNICVYCDGTYWHSRSDAMEKDIMQTNELREFGYVVIRLKGLEIRNGIGLEILKKRLVITIG